MKTMTGGAAILAMMLSLGAADLAAQQSRAPGPRARAEVADRLGRGGGAPGVEGILRMRERLELTEDQVSRLDALRSERVEQRMLAAAEMNELRSELRAGTIERTEAMERMRTAREARVGQAEQDRAAVEALLDDNQRTTVEQFQSQRRAFEAGRRSALRGQARGMRGGGEVRGPRRGGPPQWQGRPGLRGGPPGLQRGPRGG
ncbi:MAG: Spy/CpxP family protein refolding chaperone [Gemmatimonadota bacterium]